MNIVCFYGFVYDGLPVETCETLRVVFVFSRDSFSCLLVNIVYI